MLRHLKCRIGETLEWMAKTGACSYVAGPDLEDALRVCHSPPHGERKFIICLWDSPGASPRAVFNIYERSLNAIIAHGLQCHLSVKVPSLHYDHGMALSLIERAAPYNVRVHFDALTAEGVEPTFRLLRRARPRFENLGCTIPSRWRRSAKDILEAKALHIPIRLVSGQIRDRQGGEIDPRAGYVTLVSLLEGYQSGVGIASHCLTVVLESVRRLRGSATPWELEQLYRLRPIDRKIVDAAQARLYVPFGVGYAPYDVYDAWRQPEIGMQLLRDFTYGMLHRSLTS